MKETILKALQKIESEDCTPQLDKLFRDALKEVWDK
jgi:hypothetical protein